MKRAIPLFISERARVRLNRYFDSNIEIPRMRVGKRQTIETLINEEALIFGKYLRTEKVSWNPRLPIFSAREWWNVF